MDLIDITKKFGTQEACNDFLEKLRWPDGVECLYCNGKRVTKYLKNSGLRTVKDPATGEPKVNKATGEVETKPVPGRILYVCLDCKNQFSVTEGTIFNDTHLPLEKWFMAVALMVNAKKGLSALQLKRDLKVAYKTAWYLAHRIREAMGDSAPSTMNGVVEMDESFIGARKYDKRRKTILPHGKMPVFGMIQRSTDTETSKVYAVPIRAANKFHVTGAFTNRLSPEAELVITDESRIYRSLGEKHRHETVNHIRLEYVRKGDQYSIHTNSIENFWSLFKRGVIGSFHKVSLKHLRRYLDEFSYRFNNRREANLWALVIAALTVGIPLPYKELTAKLEDTWPQVNQDGDEPF